MERGVVGRVEMPVDSCGGHAPAPPVIEVLLLGPLALRRAGVAIPLPPSRKVRAVLAYLALAPRPVARSALCEMFWDVPNDPRGELRWCLSKLRSVLDTPGRTRVETREDTVALELGDCQVDALVVAQSAGADVASLAHGPAKALAGLYRGDLLDGLELDRSPAFSAWLTAQRRRFRGYHAALLEHLATTAPAAEAIAHLENWLELAPFDAQVHARLLAMLVRQGRITEAEAHLAAAARRYASEGLDSRPLHAAWGAARAAPLEPAQPASAPSGERSEEEVSTIRARRASIAVMPFVDMSPETGMRGGPADALAHDIITRLAKLRGLFVIAQGTVFALHERRVGPEEAGRMLGVDYVVGGSLRRHGGRLVVAVELTEARTARIVWAETFNEDAVDAFAVLDAIGDRIVASIATEIETIERNRAILRPPSSLDAWEAHHRGLWHMYRFSQADNEQARHFFEVAVRLDPTFARAYAGLSFTHWQSAFQGWSERGPDAERAYAFAGQSLMADDRDPTAHWAMGRALWLLGRHDQAVVELEQSVDLSPNFAQGHYTLAFVQAQVGNAQAAIVAADHSRALSPFDPLLFGMLGARAIALVRLGRFEEAAAWGAQAATRPNAHVHITAIAAFSAALAGSMEEASRHAAEVHRQRPGYKVADFLHAFQLDDAAAALFHEGARRVGMGR